MSYLQLFESGKYSDFTIEEINSDRTESKEHLVHKCILAISSPYFEGLLECGMKEKNKLEFMTPVKVGFFRYVLKFIYSEMLEPLEIIAREMKLPYHEAVISLYQLFEMLMIKKAIRKIQTDVFKTSYTSQFHIYTSLHHRIDNEEFFENLRKRLATTIRSGEIEWLSDILLDQENQFNEKVFEDTVLCQTITHLIGCAVIRKMRDTRVSRSIMDSELGLFI